MLPDKLAFVDIETTGMSYLRDRIIEIAILRVQNNQLVSSFHSVINPETYVSPYIEALTGITKEEIDNAPVFSSVQEQIAETLKDCLFVAHNVRFDYGFIRNEFGRQGISFSLPKCCTVRLSRHFFPQAKKHNLDSVIERLGIVCEQRHRALGDAKVLWEFYQKLLTTYPIEDLAIAIERARKRPSFPIGITQKLINQLPQAPGVYIFSDKQGAVLYVGKSVNIKDRVLSHFTQNENPTDLKIWQGVANIEIIQTAGELGALLKEAQLIKQLQPVYNRQLRRRRQLITLIKKTTKQGYDTASVEVCNEISIDQTNNVLGIFKNKRQTIEYLRKITKEFHLCPKLLGLEKTQSSCIHHQFGWCKGACIQKELTVAYNIRFLQAFSKTKIDRWPFDGPISIVEKSAGQEETTVERFFINNWCYIAAEEIPATFDLDTYKIIRRYLRNRKNWRLIETKNPMPLSPM